MNSRKKLNTKNRSQLGGMLVEFALIAPVFFTVTLGVIETGNMFRSWLTVSKAAQAGARFATTGQGAQEGDRIQRIVAQTNKVLETLPAGTSSVDVQCWPTMDASGPANTGDAGNPCELVEVSVTFNYKPITPIVGTVMPESVPITSSGRKVNEPWQPCKS